MKSIGLRHWEGCFDDLKASMGGLECIVGVLTHDIWEVIPHEKTNEFITLFLNNLHSKRSKLLKLLGCWHCIKKEYHDGWMKFCGNLGFLDWRIR